MNPLDICYRTHCKYDYHRKCYIINVWGDYYEIFPDSEKIKRLSYNLPIEHPFIHIFIMYYMTTTKLTKLANTWISEKDLYGGVSFFCGPHTIPTKLISDEFLNDIINLSTKCKQLQGTPIQLADLGYSFKITHNITVAMLYWLGDDVFKAEAKLLFDKSIERLLPLDIVFSLATDVCNRFVNN